MNNQPKEVDTSVATATVKANVPETKFWPRELVLGLIPLLTGLQLLAWIAYIPMSLGGVADFRSLYTAGYLVRAGQSRDLYDGNKVLQIQQHLVPLPGAMGIRMDHPAYEALLFAPLSLFQYRHAFALFLLLNVVAFLLCVRLVAPYLSELRHSWRFLPLLLFASFFPVTRTMAQGQDSVILLLLVCAAYLYFRNTRELKAGILLGLALFKFQIVIPIAIVFALWKRWRFVLGFATSSAFVGLISLFMVGAGGARQYALMLLDLSINLRSQADALRYSISPRTMLNVRGLMSALLEGRVGHWTLQLIVVALSILIVFFAARCKPSFVTAILAASLVSYHLNVQDAIVMIIPIGVILCGTYKVDAAIAALALVLPFTAIWPLLGYIGAIPFLLLFFVTVFRSFREQTIPEDYSAFACGVAN